MTILTRKFECSGYRLRGGIQSTLLYGRASSLMAQPLCGHLSKRHVLINAFMEIIIMQDSVGIKWITRSVQIFSVTQMRRWSGLKNSGLLLRHMRVTNDGRIIESQSTVEIAQWQSIYNSPFLRNWQSFGDAADLRRTRYLQSVIRGTASH